MQTTILLPTYNEAGNIVLLLKELLAVTPPSVRFLLVDDDSPDGTADLVKDYVSKTKTKRVAVLVRTVDHGLTRSLKDGIQAAGTDAVGWMDCDFSHPPEYIPALITKLETDFDVVLASRYLPGGMTKSTKDTSDSPLSIYFSRFLNILCRVCFGNDVSDYSTGFLIARKSVLENIQLRGDYGEYCIDFVVRAKRAGYRIGEIPYASKPRLSGASKTSPTLSVLLKRSVQYAWSFVLLLLRR